MRDKIGLPLDEIHISGNVPQCKLKPQHHGFCYSDRLIRAQSQRKITHQHGEIFQTDAIGQAGNSKQLFYTNLQASEDATC